MGGLFDDIDDTLDDDDYVEDYDDEQIELDSELGTDYHEVREGNSISHETPYLHPELTSKTDPIGGGSYVPIPRDAKRSLPGTPNPPTAVPGYIVKKKLPAKLRNKHKIKHIVIRHKNGKRTILV